MLLGHLPDRRLEALGRRAQQQVEHRRLRRVGHDGDAWDVRERRGEKLNDSYDDLFSGAFWVGAEALDLGLIDGLGDIRTILRQRFGDKVQFRMIEPARPPLLGRLLSRRSLGQSSLIDPHEIVGALEERAAWARLGL